LDSGTLKLVTEHKQFRILSDLFSGSTQTGIAGNLFFYEKLLIKL